MLLAKVNASEQYPPPERNGAYQRIRTEMLNALLSCALLRCSRNNNIANDSNGEDFSKPDFIKSLAMQFKSNKKTYEYYI
jgi:hypothetical protein